MKIFVCKFQTAKMFLSQRFISLNGVLRNTTLANVFPRCKFEHEWRHILHNFCGSFPPSTMDSSSIHPIETTVCIYDGSRRILKLFFARKQFIYFIDGTQRFAECRGQKTIAQQNGRDDILYGRGCQQTQKALFERRPLDLCKRQLVFCMHFLLQFENAYQHLCTDDIGEWKHSKRIPANIYENGTD